MYCNEPTASLQAPVSGSKKPAIDGTLIFLAAGDESLYKEAVPALDLMGKAHFFLGEVGAGARMKLVVNMVMGSMMCMSLHLSGHPAWNGAVRGLCDHRCMWSFAKIVHGRNTSLRKQHTLFTAIPMFRPRGRAR